MFIIITIIIIIIIIAIAHWMYLQIKPVQIIKN